MASRQTENENFPYRIDNKL